MQELSCIVAVSLAVSFSELTRHVSYIIPLKTDTNQAHCELESSCKHRQQAMYHFNHLLFPVLPLLATSVAAC